MGVSDLIFIFYDVPLICYIYCCSVKNLKATAAKIYFLFKEISHC